ncbi:MAG: NUDIX hydrolase [bacterium]|nr:NUDIX hydrolase [bacterium]
MIYRIVPASFNPLFEVVGCFLDADGEILLLRRNPEKSEGGKWGVPGGKIDSGETRKEAMIRELQEETGYAIQEERLGYIDTLHVEHPRHQFVYHLFTAQLDSKPVIALNPHEHQQYLWVKPPEALMLDLVTDVDGCIAIVYAPGKER